METQVKKKTHQKTRRIQQNLRQRKRVEDYLTNKKPLMKVYEYCRRWTETDKVGKRFHNWRIQWLTWERSRLYSHARARAALTLKEKTLLLLLSTETQVRACVGVHNLLWENCCYFTERLHIETAGCVIETAGSGRRSPCITSLGAP